MNVGYVNLHDVQVRTLGLLNIGVPYGDGPCPTYK